MAALADLQAEPQAPPPSFQPEDVAALFSQDTFIQSSPEERQRLFNAVAGSAYQTLASDPRFDRDSYKAWGEALDQGRKKLDSMVTSGEKVSQGVEGLKGMAGGLAKQVGAAASVLPDAESKQASDLLSLIGLGDLLPKPVKGDAGEISSTFGLDFINGLARIGESTETLAAKGISLANKDASIWKLGKGLENLKSQIDTGKIPVSAETFAPWIQGESSKLNQFQRQWSKSLDFGIVPNEVADKTAQANSLTDNPQNAQLLAQYIATRDPQTWEQLRSNMLKTTARMRIDKAQGLIDTTEGSKQFDAMFGEGAHQHLQAGADPINLAAMVFPALKGAAAGEAAVAATKLGRLGQVAVRGLKQVPTNFALGAAGALAQDPNARAGTVFKQGLETAAGGALIHTLAGTPSALLKRSEGVSGASGGVSEARSPDTPPDAPVQLQQDAQRTTSITDDQANEIFGGKPDVRILGEEPVSQLSPPPQGAPAEPSLLPKAQSELEAARQNLTRAMSQGGDTTGAQVMLDIATRKVEQLTTSPAAEAAKTIEQSYEEANTSAGAQALKIKLAEDERAAETPEAKAAREAADAEKLRQSPTGAAALKDELAAIEASGQKASAERLKARQAEDAAKPLKPADQAAEAIQVEEAVQGLTDSERKTEEARLAKQRAVESTPTVGRAEQSAQAFDNAHAEAERLNQSFEGGVNLHDYLSGMHEPKVPQPDPETPVAKEASEAAQALDNILSGQERIRQSPRGRLSLADSLRAQEKAQAQKAALDQKVARGDAVSTDTVETHGIQTPPTYIPGSDGVSRNTRPTSYEGHLAVQAGHVPSPAEALPGEIASPEAQPDALPPTPFTDFLRKETQGRWNEEAYRAAQEGRTGDLSSTQRKILGRVEREFEDQNPETRQAARRQEAQRLREERAGKATVGSDLPPEGETRTDDPSVEAVQDKPSGFTNLNVASKLFNESGATTIPHALYEAARWGAHRIQAGFRDFAEWSAEMVKKFGNGIRPHLNDLFSMSRDNYYELTGKPSPWTEVKEGYAEGLKDMSDSLKRGDAKKMLTAQRDVVDDQAAFAGNRSANAVRQAFGYKENLPGGDRNPTNQHVDYDMRAAAFVLESGGDRTLLSQQANDLRNAPKPKQYTQEAWDRFKNKWVPMLDYAVQHFDELNKRAQIATNLLAMERASEVSAGLEVGEVDNYITHRYKNIAQMQGDPTTNGVFGGSGTSRFSKYFTKERTYDHMASAMVDGYDPTSTNVADLVGYRIKAGQTLVRQKQLEHRLFNIRDSATGDFLLKPIDPKLKSAPPGYVRMTLGGSDSYVFKPYERVMRQLYGESFVRGSTIGNALLKTEGFIKHGNVVWDSYHAARVMFNQLAATGRVGWRKGYSLLEYSPTDLGNMLADGQITKEIHDYAVNPVNQARTKNLINGGLVANRLIENLDADAVGWVRKAAKAIAGAPGDRLMEGVQSANHYIFQKLTRGSMIQTALSFTDRYVRQGLSEEAAASRAAKEVNEMFGNVGRQGWFRSQGARDLSQLLMFAPSWTNGRIAYELRAGGQMLSSLKNAATLKKISLGNAARTMGTTYLGALAAAQVINYATKGQSTFENDEGHKTMAWIPIIGSEKGGFYFDPLYFAAPITAALAHGYDMAMNRGRTGPEATADAVGQLMGSKMSPLLRAALIETPIPGVGGKDYAGRPFKTATDRHLAAVSNLLPTPIPLSSVIRDHTMKGVEKQVFSSVGVHLLPAPTATQQMFGLATPFRPKEDGAIYPVSKYAPIKQAVQDGSKETAQQTMIDLARKGEVDLDKLDHEFGYTKDGYKGRTFTGSHDRERAMIKTLTPEQLGTYQDALKEQRDWAHTYHQWRNEVAPQIREATKAFKEEARDEGIYVPKKLKRAS